MDVVKLDIGPIPTLRELANIKSLHLGESSEAAVFLAADHLLEEARGLHSAASLILESIRRPPYFALVRGLQFQLEEQFSSEVVAMAFAKTIGVPSPTGGHMSRCIWRVEPRPVSDSMPEKTFSERTGPADLHTDSQYRLEPEDYVALFVLKPANDGGASTVLNYDCVFEELSRSDEGRGALDLLMRPVFPFSVPPAFRVRPSEAECVIAPIIAQAPQIRYRKDTLAAGLARMTELNTPDTRYALGVFEESLKRVPGIVTITVGSGEILMLNNHRVLHGRTNFRDRSRRLLRIRMNCRGPIPSADS